MKSLLLSVSFFSLIFLCFADVDTELSKLEGELEKLQLSKAKRELVNDVEAFLSARAERKRSVESKAEEVKEATEVKEAKSDDDKSLEELVEEFNAKNHKKSAGESNMKEEFFKVFIDREQRRKEEEMMKQAIGAVIDQEVDAVLSKRSIVSGFNTKCLKAKDQRPDCAHYKATKGCGGKYKELMDQYCYKTCNCGCVDALPKPTCDRLVKGYACQYNKKKMVDYCPGSCGFCKTPSPPPCAKTAYGCCWDEVTTKRGPKGKNCPKCYDAYKSACQTFKPDCNSGKRPGIFMRKYCSHSCDQCSGKCKDHPTHAAECHLWKQIGACQNDVQTMKLYCAQTCGLCGKLFTGNNNVQGK